MWPDERRQGSRIQDLVKSYWPLTSRVRAAEADAERMKGEVSEAEARARETQRRMDELM